MRTFFVLCVVFGVLLSISEGSIAARNKQPTAAKFTDSYKQFSAVQYTYTETSITGWNTFNSDISNLTNVLHDKRSGLFIMTSGNGNLVFLTVGTKGTVTTMQATEKPVFDSDKIAIDWSEDNTKTYLMSWNPLEQNMTICTFQHDLNDLKCQQTTVQISSAGQRSPTAVRQLSVQHELNNKDAMNRKSLMAATDSGLYRLFFTYALVGQNYVPAEVIALTTFNGTVLTTNDVTQVYCLPAEANPNAKKFFGGQCFASTNEHTATSNAWTCDQVHRIRGSVAQHRYKAPGIIDARPTAMVFDPSWDAIHMVNEICDNVLFSNGTLMRVEGYHGKLPQKNLTSAAAVSGSVWIGSKFGVMRRAHSGAPFDGHEINLFQDETPWRYFNGPRWMPTKSFDPTEGNMALSIAAAPATATSVETAVVVATTGITIIQNLNMTLSSKEEKFMDIVYPRHDRYGLVSDVPLKEFGNLDTYMKKPGANDGLWTSLYVASQSFKYATTQDPIAKKNAWHSLNGMRLLVNATGIRGLPGRSVDKAVNGSCSVLGSCWHKSPIFDDWCWCGTTSSDEITGHLHIYSIFHDLIAETPEEKNLLSEMIWNMTSHIVDNNFTLVGYDGKPTHWGRWGPQDLNDNQFFYDGRGVNSLQIVAYLSAAYRITNDTKFADAFYKLVDEYGYGENLVNAKITQPSDVNYSDDELTFLPYLLFIWSGRPSAMMQTNPLFEHVKDKVLLSIQRTYRYVRREKPDLWTFIYLAFLEGYDPSGASQAAEDEHVALVAQLASETETLVGNALFNLRTQPLSWVYWPIDNSMRLDVIADPHVNRNHQAHQLIENLVPYDENCILRWNGNPYQTRRGSGYDEVDPSAWLYPYWLGRYLNYVPAPQ